MQRLEALTSVRALRRSHGARHPVAAPRSRARRVCLAPGTRCLAYRIPLVLHSKIHARSLTGSRVLPSVRRLTVRWWRGVDISHSAGRQGRKPPPMQPAPQQHTGPRTWRAAPTGVLLWLGGPLLLRRLPLASDAMAFCGSRRARHAYWATEASGGLPGSHVWGCPCSLRFAPLSHSERVHCTAWEAYNPSPPEDAHLPGPLRVRACAMAGTMQ